MPIIRDVINHLRVIKSMVRTNGKKFCFEDTLRKRGHRIFMVALLTLLLSLSPLAGAENEIRLAGEAPNPWKDLITWSGLSLEKGKWGSMDILLKDKEYTCTGETDLLLHFNTSSLKEECGHYELTPVKGMTAGLVSEKVKVFGTGAFAFQEGRNLVRLLPKANSLFQKGWQDFTIEFWLYPVNLMDHEAILYWSGNIPLANKSSLQYTKCQIIERKLQWEFHNFFIHDKPTQFVLTGLNYLLPRTWAHHLLRFDSSTGLLEYLVNGELEGVMYTTVTGEEGSGVFIPKTDPKGVLDIVPNFTGLMDELRLSDTFITNPWLSRYQGQAGACMSRILDLAYTGSRIQQINATYNEPDNSALYFYYRLSDKLEDYAGAEAAGQKMEWQPFLPNKLFASRVAGRYLQLKVEFLPDGTGTQSPLLSALSVLYEPDLPPTPPAFVIAQAGNGQVTLTWQKVNEADVKGYEIYYGNEPGNYFGTDCLQGRSPIVVMSALADHKTMSMTLSRLTNGRLYYFNVVSIDNSVPPHKSRFSKEVSARPSSLASVMP